MATTTALNIIKDINGIPSYTLQQSKVIYTGKLTAGVPQSITAPSDAKYYMVRIGVTIGADIFVSVNGTATLPTGAPTLSATEINIAQTYVAAGGTISIMSDAASAYYSLGFYSVV